jgi:hypothetical protein
MSTALRVIAWIAAALLFGLGLVILIAVITQDSSPTAAGWLIIVVLLGLGGALGVVATLAKASRPCPQCGKGVKKGLVICPTCGFDFATTVPGAKPGPVSATPAQPPQPPQPPAAPAQPPSPPAPPAGS